MAEPGAATIDEPPAPARTDARPLRFWRRVSLRKQMLLGFSAPVLIILLASLFLLRELGTLSSSAKASVESVESIGLRHELLNSVLDAETGVRGFQLTGDPEFLQPYASGLLNFDRIIDRLNADEGSDPKESGNLEKIQDLFGRWKREFAEPQIRLREGAPVGEADQLRLLAGLATAPISAVPEPGQGEHLRAYSHIVEWVRARLELNPRGPHAAEVQAVLELAATARSASVEGVAARPRLIEALQALTEKVQADEDRISSGLSSRQGKILTDAIRVVAQSSLRQQMLEQDDAADTATADVDHAIWVAMLVPVASLLIGLVATLLLLLDAVRAINDTGKAAGAVAGGDLKMRLEVDRRDEIGQLGMAFNRMAGELDDRQRRSLAIDRFQTLLVTSNSMDEIYAVVERMCDDMFPGSGGAVYRIAASRNMAERVAQWRWPDAANSRVVHPEDCRALRSGKPYFSGAGTLEVPCRHVQQIGVAVPRSLCMPLAAHGEIFGILQLCRFDGDVTGHGAAGEPAARDMETAVLISEQLSMSLANLQLREQLRNQSIRDPLTALFNRRYLEETMERELARTARNSSPLAVITIDVDHFKKFNDSHGHEAGDKVLVELAGALRGGIRTTDIACRYGGEEFVLLMPDSPLAIAVDRMEALRRRTSELHVRVGNVELDPITISCGIAVAPQHGDSGDTLLRNADAALYAAKAAGRNRVVVWEGGQG